MPSPARLPLALLLLGLAEIAAAADPLVVVRPEVPAAVPLGPDHTRLLAVSPDGTTALLAEHLPYAGGGSWMRLGLWDLAAGTRGRSVALPYGYEPTAGVYSPDGTRVAVEARGGDPYGRLLLLDPAAGSILFDVPAGEPHGVIGFAADGAKLVQSTLPGRRTNEPVRLRVRDAKTGAVLAEKELPDAVPLAVSPDGTAVVVRSPARAAGGRKADCAVWDAATLTRRAVLDGLEDEVQAASFTRAGDRLLTLSTRPARDRLRLWDPSTGKLIRTVPVDAERANAAAVSPDGKTVAVGWVDRFLSFHDAATGAELGRVPRKDQTLAWGNPNLSRFTPDGRRFVVNTSTGTRVIDPATGDVTGLLGASAPPVSGVRFGPGGELLVGGPGRVTAWDPAAAPLAAAVRVGAPFGRGVVPVGDGTRALAFGGTGFGADLWDTATGKAVCKLGGLSEYHRSVTASPDGKWVAAVAPHPGGRRDDPAKPPAFTVWDAATGKTVRTTEVGGTSLAAVAFTADGRLAVLAGDRVEFRDLSTGEVKQTWKRDAPAKPNFFQGSDDQLAAVAPDGSFVVGVTMHPTRRSSFTVSVVRDGSSRPVFGGWDHPAALAVSPDGKRVAVVIGGGRDGGAHLVPVPGPDDPPAAPRGRLGGRELAMPDDAATSVAFSADGKRVAVGGVGGAVRVFGVASADPVVSLWTAPAIDPAADSDWLAWTPAGAFAGTKRGEQFLRWRAWEVRGLVAVGGGGFVRADRARDPAAVVAALAGR